MDHFNAFNYLVTWCIVGLLVLIWIIVRKIRGDE